MNCPKDPSHRLTTEAVTKKGSPHTIKVLCAEEDCGAFVKWGTHQDVLAINMEAGAREVSIELEALRRHMKPVIDAMRKVGLI